MSASAQLILVAGGMGTRLGSELPKALVTLVEIPLFIRSLMAFEPVGLTEGAVVVHPADWEGPFREALDEFLPEYAVTLVAGGEERYHSVRNGLAAVLESTEIVAVHDAARPFPKAEVIREALKAAEEVGAATVATACTDTILQGDADRNLDSTPDRSMLWACQTPQIFQKGILAAAYAGAIPERLTDDATLVRGAGQRVRIVEGPDTNMKITTRQDLDFAAYRIEKGIV